MRIGQRIGEYARMRSTDEQDKAAAAGHRGIAGLAYRPDVVMCTGHRGVVRGPLILGPLQNRGDMRLVQPVKIWRATFLGKVVPGDPERSGSHIRRSIFSNDCTTKPFAYYGIGGHKRVASVADPGACTVR